jgi:hypothetical protein
MRSVTSILDRNGSTKQYGGINIQVPEVDEEETGEGGRGGFQIKQAYSR